MKAKRFSRILNPHWYNPCPDAIPAESDWIKVDVDNYWKEVIEMDVESELIHEIADNYFWQVMIKHIGLTDQERKVFSDSFFNGEARRGRLRAIHGTIALNRIEESELIDASNAFWESILPDIETGEHSKLTVDEHGREWDLVRIGYELVKLITERDHKAFKKIAEILQQKNGVTTAPSKQNKSPNYEKAWRGFCEYVRDNQKLPTKLTFKNKAGLSKDQYRDPNGTKAMKALGLSGLPD